MLELSGFQVALILLGGVWGALGIIVNIFSLLNERRDLVLRITERKAKLSADQERVLFFNDWLPLWIGSCLFLAFISSMFYLLCRRLPSKSATASRPRVDLPLALRASVSLLTWLVEFPIFAPCDLPWSITFATQGA
jgi:hypothetical protein